MYQRYGVALVTLTLLHTTISSFDTCDVVIIIMINVIVFVVLPVFLLQPRYVDPPPAGPSVLRNFNPGIFGTGFLQNPGIPGFFGTGLT